VLGGIQDSSGIWVRWMTTTAAPDKRHAMSGHNEGGSGAGQPRLPRGKPGGGFLSQYKPDQGKATRTGTFVGLAVLVVWGGKFVNDHLTGYQGDEAWQLLITPGIAILFAVVMGALAWRVAYVNRKSSDFMIATEGEMKKVSWATKDEVIGSTKVVILFTVLLAVLLFVVDLFFQFFFSWINVLKA